MMAHLGITAILSTPSKPGLQHTIEGLTTPKVIKECLILSSVCQTCKYMDVDFLHFLRSGEKDVHAFAESRQGQNRRFARDSSIAATLTTARMSDFDWGDSWI